MGCSTSQVAESEKPTDGNEEFSLITTGARKATRKSKAIDEDEPLIDTTVKLPLRSKKTERAQKRLYQKQQRAATARQTAPSLLDLPPELLQEIFGYLQPTHIFTLLRVNKSLHTFIQTNSTPIALDIISRRYWILSQCLPLPVPFSSLDPADQKPSLSTHRQDLLQIHKKPYHHVKGIDPTRVCTCMTCVFAWNNLCLALDLAHWQRNLNAREPIPMIPRGANPAWNKTLLDTHADIVSRAMNGDRLIYAAILETHLRTTTQTLLRTFRGKKTVHPRRLYHLTPTEAAQGTDEFLSRSGPPSYEFPWHRDNYYALEAYVPNRKWSREREGWVYYAEGGHRRDLAWIRERFGGAG